MELPLSRPIVALDGTHLNIYVSGDEFQCNILAIVNNKTIDPACDNLAEGEPLCLGAVGEDCTTIHVVAEGDSCPTIDSAAGIDLQTLVANNPQLTAECKNIYPGEVLCVSNEDFNYNITIKWVQFGMIVDMFRE